MAAKKKHKAAVKRDESEDSRGGGTEVKIWKKMKGRKY